MQNAPLSPTPQRQPRVELRAAKKTQKSTADITAFFEFYENKTKACKFCL